MPRYMITDESVTLTYRGKTYTVKNGDDNFAEARKAVFEQRWDDVPGLLCKGLAIAKWADGHPGFKYEEGTVFFNKNPVPKELNDRMVNMAADGSDPGALFNFWARLQENPSMRSVEQLWGFLEHENIPLTPDGHFLAYKSVRPDFKDWHSGNISNKPGEEPTFPRNQISDDPKVACHKGLHVGALPYAEKFHAVKGRLVVVCKVDPADVVCVPYDASQQKIRVCRYKVTGLYKGTPLPSTSVKEVRTAPPKQTQKSLMERTIRDLRLYARTLGVPRPNNIVGGKKALVQAILKALK